MDADSSSRRGVTVSGGSQLWDGDASYGAVVVADEGVAVPYGDDGAVRPSGQDAYLFAALPAVRPVDPVAERVSEATRQRQQPLLLRCGGRLLEVAGDDVAAFGGEDRITAEVVDRFELADPLVHQDTGASTHTGASSSRDAEARQIRLARSSHNHSSTVTGR